MGFYTVHRWVQIHTIQRFRASADLEESTHQIQPIQYRWKTKLHRWWNHGLGSNFSLWSHWSACVLWKDSDCFEISHLDPISANMPWLFVTILFYWIIIRDLNDLCLLKIILSWNGQFNLQNGIRLNMLGTNFGRPVNVLNPSSRPLHKLEQDLIRLWSSHIISVSYKLIGSNGTPVPTMYII